mgnify:CR=1 FL=1
MTDTQTVASMRPATTQDVADILMDAAHNRPPLVVRGNGPPAGLGTPVAATQVLELGGLHPIDFYDPADPVIRAGVGATLARVEQILSQ